MFFNFEDIGQVCASFQCDANANVGEACSITASRTAGKCKANDPICGKILSIRNRVANVAVRGFVTVPYTGTAPHTGYVCLCSDGNGGVCTCSEGKHYLVVEINLSDKTVTFLL